MFKASKMLGLEVKECKLSLESGSGNCLDVPSMIMVFKFSKMIQNIKIAMMVKIAHKLLSNNVRGVTIVGVLGQVPL